MRQWPFAHEYGMTYILSNGELEVRVAVSNRPARSQCLWRLDSIRFFRIPDVPSE